MPDSQGKNSGYNVNVARVYSEKTNKFGLNRYIPADIARQIRIDAGFGCVVCGSAFYHYEHIDPTFQNAKEHDPAAMTLLCGGCHDRVTRKVLSKETIKIFKKNPITKRKGFSFGPLDISSSDFIITLGNNRIRECENLISIDGKPVIAILEPEEDGEPLRLTALFTDSKGLPLFAVKNNEWRIPNHVCDAEVIGSKIYIRQSNFRRTLILSAPNRNELLIERAIINVEGNQISFDFKEGMLLPGNNRITNAVISKCKTAIDVDFNLNPKQQKDWLDTFDSLIT